MISTKTDSAPPVESPEVDDRRKHEVVAIVGAGLARPAPSANSTSDRSMRLSRRWCNQKPSVTWPPRGSSVTGAGTTDSSRRS
jgi:hypothetical protein